MKRCWIRAVLVLWVLSLVLICSGGWLGKSHPLPPLTIRIAGVTTNTLPPGLEWLVAVSKPSNERPANLFWSVAIQETNNGFANPAGINLSPTESELMNSGYGPAEAGILTWGTGNSLKTGTVYRAIGNYHEPGPIETKLRNFSSRVPGLNRILPQPRGQWATSRWFKVEIDQKPRADRP